MRECQTIEGLALLMGGDSREAEISRDGARQVAAALTGLGIDFRQIDVSDRLALAESLRAGEISCAFNLVHGEFGEDGGLAAMLELHGIAHTGARSSSAVLCYDKDLCKCVWRGHGLPTPDWTMIGPDTVDTAGLDYPLVCKPTRSGSSLGIAIAENEQQLRQAVAAGQSLGPMMAESLVAGREYSASFVQGELLPVIELVVPGQFYDYEAKYLSDATEYLPAPHIDSDPDIVSVLNRAWQTLDCRAWGRIDFICDPDEGARLLEINSVPGMGGHSLLPKSAALAGYSYERIVAAIAANIDGAGR